MRVPLHWWLSGPGKLIDASTVFRRVRAAGGHASTYRRLFRLGPWAVVAIRYRPGDGPAEKERIP